MPDGLHRVVIPPEILERGFWLYVWVVTLRDGNIVHYVGGVRAMRRPRGRNHRSHGSRAIWAPTRMLTH